MSQFVIVSRNCFIAILISAFGSVTAHAADFYVATTGTPSGNGSLLAPWDLQTALQHPSAVKPGDGIWLRGGVYTSSVYNSKLRGEVGANITVRPYQQESVIIQSGIAQNTGGYVTFRDFEITAAYSNNPKRVSAQTGSSPTDISAVSGVSIIAAPGMKLINLVIHDVVGVGIYINAQSPGAELNGNIIYHNGYDAPDRPHGHGLYLQNTGATLLVKDNIIFANSELGIQAYGSAAPVTNMTFDGNIVLKSKCVIGGVTPASGINFTNNLIGEDVFLPFYYNNQLNKDLSITNNHFFNNVQAFWWESLVMRDNYFYGGYEIRTQATGDTSRYAIDSNRYYASPPLLSLSSGTYTYTSFCAIPTPSCIFQSWRANQLDLNGSFQATLPTTPTVIIKQNDYDSTRLDIVVYNWNQSSDVAVDLSTKLQLNEYYEIRDAQDYLKAPFKKGTYTGGSLSISMSNTATEPFKGDYTGAYHPPEATHSSNKFGAFVLVHYPGSAARPLPPTGLRIASK